MNGSLELVPSHCESKSIFCVVAIAVMEWIQYPFMMATAMIKMGIMVTDGGVYIVTGTENKND